MNDNKSEFGKGFIYCLSLFLAHADRKLEYESIYTKIGLKSSWPELWFNGAADHLYELEIPDNIPQFLKTRCEILRDKSLKWRCSLGTETATKTDVLWAIEEVKEILRLIDEFHGTKTIIAEWT